MSRIPAVDPAAATGEARDLLDAVKGAFGVVPNLYRVAANAPKALKGLLTLNGALGEGVIDAPTRERIALAVAEVNGCEYCLSAHGAIGRKLGLSSDEVTANRRGTSTDAKANALITFARAVQASRGNVTDLELSAVRAAGVTDAEIVEVVGHVALNTYTNFLNNVARTVVDFPKAAPLGAHD